MRLEEDKEAWLTHAQMLQIWHDGSVVSAMKMWAASQVDMVRVRPHPKIPDCIGAVQYKVQTAEQEVVRFPDVVRKRNPAGV